MPIVKIKRYHAFFTHEWSFILFVLRYWVSLGFRLPKGGVHATSFSWCYSLIQFSRRCLNLRCRCRALAVQPDFLAEKRLARSPRTMCGLSLRFHARFHSEAWVNNSAKRRRNWTRIIYFLDYQKKSGRCAVPSVWLNWRRSIWVRYPGIVACFHLMRHYETLLTGTTKHR